MGAEPRVVDEHVDPAEPDHRRLDEGGAGGGIGDVGDDREPGDDGDVTAEAEPVENAHGHTPAGRVWLTLGPSVTRSTFL